MLRAHVGLLADIGHRLLQNVAFHCQRVQCLRVGNTMIPDHKRIEIALQHIHGIGRRRAHQILCQLGVGNRPTRDLTATEINLLKDEVSKYLTAGDLKRVVESDIKKLADIQCYRGYRHACMLPCRGQRTKTNARTMKEHRRRGIGNWERSQALAQNMEKYQEREQGR
uniref:Uncharacterized protein n=1 Tax=Rhizophora mucronata TaxID=61149 RepID=A0A2P2J3Y5_RHIMU